MGVFKFRALICWLCLIGFIFGLLLPINSISGEYHIKSGVYEGLMFAVDAHGKATGYYQENQGEGVIKTCSFYISGNVTSDEFNVMTWNDQVFPGKIKLDKKGIKLVIEKGREHPGCGLVLLPEISEGIVLEEVKKTNWIDLRVVSVKRAYLYSKPIASKKLSLFVVSGNVVAVASVSGEWAQIEYIGERKTTKGWIYLNQVKAIEPPSK